MLRLGGACLIVLDMNGAANLNLIDMITSPFPVGLVYITGRDLVRSMPWLPDLSAIGREDDQDEPMDVTVAATVLEAKLAK